MKLKFVHQNQENRGGSDEHVMKEEEVEAAKEEAEVRALMAKEPVEEDMAVREPSPLFASNPLLVSVSFSLLAMCGFTFGWLYSIYTRSGLVCSF